MISQTSDRVLGTPSTPGVYGLLLVQHQVLLTWNSVKEGRNCPVHGVLHTFCLKDVGHVLCCNVSLSTHLGSRSLTLLGAVHPPLLSICSLGQVCRVTWAGPSAAHGRSDPEIDVPQGGRDPHASQRATGTRTLPSELF